MAPLFCIDDRRVVVLHIVLGPLSGVDPDLFADAVLYIGFAQQSVPLVFLVRKDRLHDAGLTYRSAHGRRNAVRSQAVCDLLQAVPCEEAVVDPAYRVCLLRVDLRLAVRSPAIAEEGLIGEEHISLLGASGFSPCHIVADILGFALGDGTIDGDVKFRGRIDAVQVLFLEVHIYLKLPEHSGDLEAVQRVPGEAADGFDDDHVHLATLALANELVEFIPLFHTGAGDTLIGVNARQLPAGFPVDAVRVITHLRFVCFTAATTVL